MTDLDDLGMRLRAVAPVLTPPPDVLSTLRPKARRHRLVRAGTRAAAAAAAVAVAVAVPTYVRRTAPLPEAIVARYGGDAAPVRYTGPDTPKDLRGLPLWVVAERVAGTRRRVVVTYRKDDHPCVGGFSSDAVEPLSALRASGFEENCAAGDLLDLRWSYGPSGTLDDPDALLYGTVPAGVRIVAAHVGKGRLAERYVTTVASPADAKHRFYLFDSPGGATSPLRADLTFYDSAGRWVGSRHVDADAAVH